MNIKKIACLYLAFRNIEVIKNSLTSILSEREAIKRDFVFDVYVVENSTEFSSSVIRPYIKNIVEEGGIKKYLQLKKNITNNAFHVALFGGFLNFDEYDYIFLTDGDVYVPPGSVKEQLSILDNNPEVFACGLSVDYAKWELGNKKEKALALLAKRSLALEAGKPYVAIPGGFWFVAFKTLDWQKLYNTFEFNGIRIHDGIIQKFCRSVYKREWVQTRNSVGRELHREFVDPSYDNISVKKKVIKNLLDNNYAGSDYAVPLYDHNDVADGIVFEREKSYFFDSPKLKPVNPVFCITYNHDPFFNGKDINAVLSKYSVAYVVRKLQSPLTPDMYFVALGIGTSFLDVETNCLVLQMRDGSSQPIKGSLGMPPLKDGSLSAIYFDTFFVSNAKFFDKFPTLIFDSYKKLRPGGFLRVVLYSQDLIEKADEALIKNAAIALKMEVNQDTDLNAVRFSLIDSLIFANACKVDVSAINNIFSSFQVKPDISSAPVDLSEYYKSSRLPINKHLSRFANQVHIYKPL